jgi:hypothetical protein
MQPSRRSEISANAWLPVSCKQTSSRGIPCCVQCCVHGSWNIARGPPRVITTALRLSREAMGGIPSSRLPIKCLFLYYISAGQGRGWSHSPGGMNPTSPTYVSLQDQNTAFQLAQPEELGLQPGNTAAHVLGGEIVPTTTPVRAGTTAGLTTPARNCSPPSACRTGRQGSRSESPRVTAGTADDLRARTGMKLPVTAAAAPEEMANAPHSNARSATKLTTAQRRGKREVRALFDGAQHDVPLRAGPVAKRTRGGCSRMVENVPLQSPNSMACPAQGFTLGCAPGGGVSKGLPSPEAMPPANTSALAAKHMADTVLTGPGSGGPPYFAPSSAYGNQGSPPLGPESAAQRLRNLQHCLTGVKTDEGGEGDPSTSSVSIGGVQGQDVHACATPEGPLQVGEGALELQACAGSAGLSQIEEGTLELSEGLQALAAQLTPSTLQLLQESLAEVEATSNRLEQPSVLCPLAGS